MGKYLKKFSTDPDRIEYEGGNDYIEPYVSYVEGDNSVHYNKVITRLTVRYNVEDTGNPTQLYMYINRPNMTILGADMFSKVEIDGTEVSVSDLDTAQGQYQLSAGEHTVKYTLLDPTFIGTEMNESYAIAKLGAVFAQMCPNIISVEIPNSVTSIGNAAFQGCNSLTSVNIPNSVTSIGSLSDQRDEGVGVFESCHNLSSVTIPSSVTSIGKNAFAYCYGLTSVTIPNSVEVIGPSAFHQLYFLTSVTIGSGVTSIGESAFADCKGLTSITIPNSVTSIDKYAFQECDSLTSVTIEATTPPTLGSNAFYDTNNCPIYVPAGTSNTYKAASGWSVYSSRIYEIGGATA